MMSQFQLVPQGASTYGAFENQGQEADQGMGPNAVGQLVVDRRDNDVGFYDAKAAFDIGLIDCGCLRLAGERT